MAIVRRNASATWRGSHKDGAGAMTTQSGVLSDTPYAFGTRFNDEKGTNPEELIAAAHAGCFNMSLAFRLTSAGFVSDTLETKAELALAFEDGRWSISSVNLILRASVPGLSDAQLNDFAQDAKENCAVSRSLRAKVSLITVESDDR